jgi:hypothetical protein
VDPGEPTRVGGVFRGKERHLLGVTQERLALQIRWSRGESMDDLLELLWK